MCARLKEIETTKTEDGLKVKIIASDGTVAVFKNVVVEPFPEDVEEADEIDLHVVGRIGNVIVVR